MLILNKIQWNFIQWKFIPLNSSRTKSFHLTAILPMAQIRLWTQLNYLAYEIIEPRPCDSCYVTKAKKGEKKVYLRTFLVC